MLRFADLKYSREELENDAIHYLTTQVYEPAFVDKVKEFIYDDLCDFKAYYDDNEYAFQSIYYDEYVTEYIDNGDTVVPQVNFKQLARDLEADFSSWNMTDEEVDQYILMLESEFRKNAFCSHMEPYFLGYDGVVATVITGYSRDPIFSIYSMVREWGMALDFKKMYPTQMRKFGYRYQYIRHNLSGDERLKKMLDFRDKYKITLKSIGMLRAVHSSLLAYTYLYLKAFLFGETEEIRDFIMDTASSQIYLLLQGEDVPVIDFPLVKEMLKRLDDERCKEMLLQTGAMNWDAIYEFVDEIISNCGGLENLRALGFEGIAAKTIRSFWNKSANMQKMLKILRQLAMGNSDPIINRLIEMCEYRLGRPDSKKKKRMERFIEHTRKLLAAHAYETSRTRMLDQQFIVAFPSVFLVYFQWHHNFRTIYPKVPKQKVYEENNRTKRQAEDTLTNKISVQDRQRTKTKEELQQEAARKSRDDESISRRVINESRRQSKNLTDETKVRSIMQNRDRTLSGLIDEQKNQKQDNAAANIFEKAQRQNSL
ncbi:MAG: hypothetical protein IJ770_02150 [Alphaproteobacteria bacterium]|nr:hypothetical protein [Alphaproteobacteria bacterium]